jgi:hypothetical protein
MVERPLTVGRTARTGFSDVADKFYHSDADRQNVINACGPKRHRDVSVIIMATVQDENQQARV